MSLTSNEQGQRHRNRSVPFVEGPWPEASGGDVGENIRRNVVARGVVDEVFSLALEVVADVGVVAVARVELR